MIENNDVDDLHKLIVSAIESYEGLISFAEILGLLSLISHEIYQAYRDTEEDD